MRRKISTSSPHRLFFGVIAFAGVWLAGCASPAQSQNEKGQAPPPPPVQIIEAKATDVPIYAEYSAQTYARDQVDVRGRVAGYVEQWLFRPGAIVRAGQPLYGLDLRPYRAAVQQARGNLVQSESELEYARQQVTLLQAQANLATAEANLVKAQQDYERFKPLVEQDAAARQDLDSATAALRAAEANVRSNKANVDQTNLTTRTQIQSTQGRLETQKGALDAANLNLEYGTIKAPISGLIGDTQVPVGGLVNPTSTTPLTTIVPLDPIWLRFQVSEADYLAHGRKGGLTVPLTLVLADNTEFAQKGRIENTLNQVDARTGTLELQARFPNPDGRLLPGQFGRVRYRASERNGVIVVPQRAIQQLQSVQTVYTVGAGNKVEAHAVKTGDRVGDSWIIEQGLKPGDRVIVEGQLRIRPGAQVDPKPFKAGR
ncbi:MAG: efflux RND transporter periplasmic adaptor subunit [Bryobacteraceae bacterium]|nr:efflux RND transporter periplasmic adaptor subunit [Bryobacteraceae bacterium]